MSGGFCGKPARGQGALCVQAMGAVAHWPVQCVPGQGRTPWGHGSDRIYRIVVTDFKGSGVKILINGVSSICQSKVDYL